LPTGTLPIINTIEDFRAIWQFLGWIDGEKPTASAHAGTSRENGSRGRLRLFAEARQTVIVTHGYRAPQRKIDGR
jgi:hypothetical protein